MEAVEKLPTSFWIIAGVGLVWNLVGLSIGGVIVQNGYGFVVANGIEVFGLAAAALPVLVIVIGVGLLLYTRSAESKGWVS
ncbi:MAG: hypothetical protein AAGA33_05370 [Pseudomonadota bacterium]